MTAVSILCTDPAHPVNAWLEDWIRREGARAQIELRRHSGDLSGGDFLFLVSCHEIIRRPVRDRYRHTLVLHASDLPRGRGMSPHVWQILEGQDRIVLTLLDASDALDSGDIWHQAEIRFDGTELHDEINAKLFDAELELMTWALDHCDSAVPRKQAGEGSFYRRRGPDDSRIDPRNSIEQVFDLLRVADPNRYPAFFELRGQKYFIRVDKAPIDST
ncbi:MAG TPA: formyltransferase family protein [Burkholderiaceae bacterium]